jgi:hypothetical protein
VSTTSILICRDPRGSQWQLGTLPPEQGSVTLIGWQRVPQPTDSGVPQEVAAVLARSLAAVARVTFPSSAIDVAVGAAWSPHSDDLVRELTARGVGGQVKAVLAGRPNKVVLVSTRAPATVMTAFDDGQYPWWLQGQVLMLSALDADPPDVDQETLFSLFDDDWTRHAAAMGARGLAGVMRPGVDGDVAGLLALADPLGGDFLGKMEHEARLAGRGWEIVDEQTFAARLAS